MSLIRKLTNGNWNKPPVLTAARLVFAKGLAEKCPERELGDMADFVNGTSYDRGRLDMGDTPIIRISNITNPTSEFIKTDEEFADRYHISTGDLLVSWSASFKSILWPGPEGILNQHIFKVTERNGHVRSYIRHAIEAAFDEMQQNVVGIGMMHLRRGDFLGHQVPCPPRSVQKSVAEYLDWIERGCEGSEPALPKELEEQRRIVAKIEHLAANIDEAHGLRQQTEPEVVALIKSARQDLIGDEPSGNWKRLGDLVDDIENGWSPACEKHPATGANWGVIKVGAVSFGRFDPTENKELPSALEPKPEYELKAGDFLMSRANTRELVGACTIVDDTPPRLMLCDKVFRFKFRPDTPIEPAYLDHTLKSPALRTQIEIGATGTSPTMKNIGKGKILNLKLPVPVPDEQRRIVEYLDGLQAKVDRLKGLQQKTAAELDALLPSILDKAFKGEL